MRDIIDALAAFTVVAFVAVICMARGAHAAALSPEAGTPNADFAIIGAFVLIVGSAIILMFPRKVR